MSNEFIFRKITQSNNPNISFLWLLVVAFFFRYNFTETLLANSDFTELKFSGIKISQPLASIPFYHLKIKIDNGGDKHFKISKLTVNDKQIYDFEIRNDSWNNNDNDVFKFNWPPFAEAYSENYIYTQPYLIARLDWQNNTRYKVEIEYIIEGSSEPSNSKLEITSPSVGGYWNSNWKYYKSIVVSEDFGYDRANEPLQFSLVFYPDQVTDLNKELRIVQIDDQNKINILPYQVYDVQSFLKVDSPRYGKDGKLRPFFWLPSIYAKIMVPISIKANSRSILLVFYGNPEAEELAFNSPMKIVGQDLNIAIENDYYKVKLHPKSGMLDEIILKSNPNINFLHKLETNGAIHWNPDAYSPPRPWMHASDWDSPENFTITSGPVFFMLHRKGFMPNMPEIGLSITYKFFANSPYFLITTSLDINKDVPVQALRNGEIVFDHKLIDKVAWKDKVLNKPELLELNEIPNLTEVHLPLDISWLSFLNTKNNLGFAGIPLEYSNVSLNNEPFEYNPYLYITKGPWVYWTRVLVTPYMTQNMQQIINVPSDNLYWEKWAMIPYELSNGNNMFDKIDSLQFKLKHPLRIYIRDEKDSRVKVPDEIYTDSTKTGWEQKQK